MEWAADKVERHKIKDLIPYERNPRVHSDTQIQQLADSILQWGWTAPILIDEESNIIAGHGRLYAAQKLGLEDAPCVVAKGWTDEQKRAYVIADNKLAENSEWDMGLFVSELKGIQSDGFNFELLGFDEPPDFPEFAPSLEPVAEGTETTQDQLDKAAENMEDNIDGISGDKAEGATQVMCPECGHEFQFSGV